MRWIGALFFVAALAIWPGVALEAARGAMEAWATSVAPALFPFVAAIPALTCPEARMAYEKWLGKAMRALFRVPASASGAIVIGFLAGSPAGATALKQTMAGETYTRAEAIRAAALVSGCSPMFLVGGVGTAMLGSHAAGLALMGAQLGALILGGLFMRFWPVREGSMPRPQAGDFKDAVSSILGVCGNMVVFSVGAALLTQSLSGAPRVAVRMVAELAMGMQAGSGAGLPLPLLGALAGFTGVCIVWQNAAVLRDCGIGMRALLPVKLLHALLCFALCLPASAIPGPARAVFSPAHPATALLPDSFAALTLLALAIAGNLWYNRKRTL